MLSWGLILLVVPGASAQIVVQGIVKPEDVPIVRPDEVPLPQAPGTKPWSLAVSANELDETTTQPGAPKQSDSATQLNAALGYNWVMPRGRIKFGSNASQLLYRQDPSQNQFLYGVGVGGSYAVTRRVGWDVNDTLTSSYAQDLSAISDAGLLPPKLLTHFNTVSSGLRYDVSAITSVRWAVSEQTVSYASSSYTGASTLTTSVNMARQLSRSQSVSFTGSYQQTVTSGTTATVLGLLGTWQRAIGKDSTLTATGGVQPYTLPGQSGFGIAPDISVSMNKRIRHSDTLGLRYNRTVEQGLGNGTHLTQEVGGSYNLSLGSRIGLDMSGFYGHGTYPLDPSHVLIGRTANVGFRCVLVQNLALVVGSSIYVRTDTPTPPVTLLRTTMSLSYGQAFR